jgi:5-methylcytosine-specific restriction enzyme subunit McrC
MVSYAFKRGCTDIILVYPNLTEELNSTENFEIISGFEKHEIINVTAMEVPFWSITDFKGIENRLYKSVEQNFKNILN